MLYTWDDPSKERCLLWNVYNKKCKGLLAAFNKVKHFYFKSIAYHINLKNMYLLLLKLPESKVVEPIEGLGKLPTHQA